MRTREEIENTFRGGDVPVHWNEAKTLGVGESFNAEEVQRKAIFEVLLDIRNLLDISTDHTAQLRKYDVKILHGTYSRSDYYHTWVLVEAYNIEEAAYQGKQLCRSNNESFEEVQPHDLDRPREIRR